jgi:alpha/beta superfamily hydrolase
MRFALALGCVLLTVSFAVADDTACGSAEKGIFQLWSLAASAADRGDALLVPNVESITVNGQGGAILRGFRMKAPGERPAGAILVIQGNATLANKLVPALEPFRALGLDVYIFDFRGFGRSKGTRRLRLMLTDYQQISSELRSRGYKHFVVYGYSFGGTLALDSLGRDAHFNALILDSTRSRIRDFGCPAELDPVEHLPTICSNVLAITGSADLIIPSAEMEELLTIAGHRGAKVVRGKGWGHPFQEPDGKPRTALVTQFLRTIAEN